MASNQNNLRDLQWLFQAIEFESISLQSISFYLSQPNSNCFQETENSININISKENLSYFSILLKELATTKTTQSLQNLEFHRVEWEAQQLQNLKLLLENNSKAKQIVFRRNRFGKECLLELSEILKRNRVIREIMLSESGIGSIGAAILASALKVNDSLEELQIWEDSIGSKGAEELSKMIEANSSIKLLTIFDSDAITANPLISENNTLRIYRLDLSGCCRVACALGLNTTVKSLDLTGIRLKSRWAKEFRWVLEQNQSLKEVNLSKTCLKDKGIVYVAAGLFKNQKLERLHLDGNWFSGVGVEHLLCPLSRFSSLQFQANITLKSVTFGGGRTKIGRDGLTAIVQMITTNESVTHLGIRDDQSLRAEDFIRIFRSLEKNASLRQFSLQGCKGVDGELLLQTIMDTLQINPWIEAIDLAKTPLHIKGKTGAIYQKLGQNGKAEPEIDLLKDMPLTVPKSCRVFLCGQEYAGEL